MKKIRRSNYTLLLSKDPCELFTYFGVEELHGLTLNECLKHDNNSKDAYITGLSNYVPKKDGNYKHGDSYFVFINISKCTSYINTVLLIHREIMHRAFELYNWDVNKEEEIISWAEKETAQLYLKLKSMLFSLRYKR